LTIFFTNVMFLGQNDDCKKLKIDGGMSGSLTLAIETKKKKKIIFSEPV